MEEIDKLLKNRRIDFRKLLEFGFVKKENQYEYKSTLIQDFDIIIYFDKSGKLDFKIIDVVSDDEYLLAKLPDATGEYVGRIKEECKSKITNIIMQCSEVQVFKSKQARQIIEYIKEKYGDEPEFLWEKFAGNAVFRHKENKKWYGVLLTISKDKLGLDSNEKVEIIDLRILPEEIENIVDNEKYFPGYHMNKKHWFTILLDESIDIEEISHYIDMSYHIK